MENGEYYATWDNLFTDDYVDADEFYVVTYNEKNWRLGADSYTRAQILSNGLPGIPLERQFEEGFERYRFTVRVDSSRPNEYQSSEVSDYSEWLEAEQIAENTTGDTTENTDDSVNDNIIINSGSSSSSSSKTDDDDDDRREDPISSSGSSLTTGGISGTSSAGTSSGSNATVKDSDDIKELIASSTTENGKVRSIGVGEVTIDASAWSEFSGQSFFHDSVVDKRVQVRVTISNPASMTGDIKVSGYTTGEKVESVTKTFNTYFENLIQVVHFDQQGRWGQEVRIAVKLDPGMNTTNLHFYSYDSDTNTYRLLQNPKYQIDANGYVHFSTEYANSIVISEGPLELK